MYIAHAAIKLENGTIYKGKHHKECFTKCPIYNPRAIQGFLTDGGVFVNREGAAQIAFDSGQLNKLPDILFSEDFWSPKYGGKFYYDSEKGYRRLEKNTEKKISMQTALKQRDAEIKELQPTIDKKICKIMEPVSLEGEPEEEIKKEAVSSIERSKEKINKLNKECEQLVCKKCQSFETGECLTKTPCDINYSAFKPREADAAKQKIFDKLTEEDPKEDFTEFHEIITLRCIEVGLDYKAYSNWKEAETAVKRRQVEITTKRLGL